MILTISIAIEAKEWKVEEKLEEDLNEVRAAWQCTAAGRPTDIP
jgi:hypothetical protein